MNKIKVISLISFCIIFLSSIIFVSCSKQDLNKNNVQTVQSQHISLAKLNNLSNLDIVKQEAYELHNEYLTNLLTAYTNSVLPTTNTLTNFNAQLSWSNNHFGTTGINMANWDVIQLMTLQQYDANTPIFNANCDRYNAFASTATKSYTNIIIDAITNTSNIEESDFIQVCEDVFTNIKADNNLDDNSKILLTAVIGVTEGSFTYWKNNLNSWPIITNPNGNPQYKWKKIVGFLAADAMGAMDGGAAGSVLPGVGTAAGAVMGGALYSGFVAWGW
ncbi:MAG: hypothetical protein R2831_05070 [Chitinophagaceae bacterium]